MPCLAGAASMPSMLVADPVPRHAMVLVTYVNFAVGTAIAQRLMERFVVALSPAASAARALHGECPFDVVVLCPYLTERERAEIHAAADRVRRAPAIVELRDLPGAASAHLHHDVTEHPSARAVVTAVSRED
jgi:hypothetical protein